MTFYHWSQTAATNGTADSTCLFPEGMAPSALNDGTRGMMAALAKYRDDTAGQIATSGTSTAYTVSSFQQFDSLADMSGKEVWFVPHVTNGATVTLNVDGQGAKPLRTAPNTELLAGVIIQGTPYGAVYNNTDGAWYLKGYFGQPYAIPLAGGMDFWGPTAPNSYFAFPQGQAISRTTYSALFALVGTTFGSGDGTTTFNLPDKVGRVSAMIDTGGARISAATLSKSTLGGVGGQQTETLSTANLPPYTPSGAVTINSLGLRTRGGGIQNSNDSSSLFEGNTSDTLSNPNNAPFAGASVSFNGNAQGGTSTPFSTVQPTIVCNYIMRVL